MTKLAYFWHKRTFLSFLAIILIVAIHNSATNQYHLPADAFTNFADLIHQFFAYGLGALAVPLFFFISGLTFFRNYRPNLYPAKLKSRFRSLVIPYLIWNIVGLLLAILYTYTPLSSLITGREAFAPSLENILSGIFLYKYNYTFWFLYNLIIFVVLTPLFDLLSRYRWLGLLTSLALLILPVFIPSFCNINCYFIIFYFLGCFLGKHYFSFFSRHRSRKISLCAAAIFLLFLALHLLKVFNAIQLPVIVSQAVLIILVLSFWCLSDLFIAKIKSRPLYQEVFPTYILHPFIIAIIVKLIYLLAPTTSWMVPVNEIASTILAIVITLTLARFWHQKLPRSYRLLFGGRS